MQILIKYLFFISLRLASNSNKAILILKDLGRIREAIEHFRIFVRNKRNKINTITSKCCIINIFIVFTTILTINIRFIQKICVFCYCDILQKFNSKLITKNSCGQVFRRHFFYALYITFIILQKFEPNNFSLVRILVTTKN